MHFRRWCCALLRQFIHSSACYFTSFNVYEGVTSPLTHPLGPLHHLAIITRNLVLCSGRFRCFLEHPSGPGLLHGWWRTLLRQKQMRSEHICADCGVLWLLYEWLLCLQSSLRLLGQYGTSLYVAHIRVLRWVIVIVARTPWMIEYHSCKGSWKKKCEHLYVHCICYKSWLQDSILFWPCLDETLLL